MLIPVSTAVAIFATDVLLSLETRVIVSPDVLRVSILFQEECCL